MSSLVVYDKELADRIRGLIGAEPDLVERGMFGGLAFLVSGNMAVAASSEGGIMVRVEPAETDRLVEFGGAHVVVMRGRRMRGWARVGSGQLASRTALAQWVGRSVSYARS
ncbi:MAG: TfoX/Sxy family protein, partial [Acidimicrobiales bacterium]